MHGLEFEQMLKLFKYSLYVEYRLRTGGDEKALIEAELETYVRNGLKKKQNYRVRK